MLEGLNLQRILCVWVVTHRLLSSIDITPNELRDALAHLQEDDAVVMTGDIRNPRITLTG